MIQMTLNYVYKKVTEFMKYIQSINLYEISSSAERRANQKKLNDAYRAEDEFRAEIEREMIKKTIYPKTERVKISNENTCEITEKLDGSNLCIFKLNEKIYIAQRNNIYTIDEINTEEVKQIMYKGLHAWLEEHKNFLEAELQDKCRNFKKRIRRKLI